MSYAFPFLSLAENDPTHFRQFHRIQIYTEVNLIHFTHNHDNRIVLSYRVTAVMVEMLPEAFVHIYTHNILGEKMQSSRENNAGPLLNCTIDLILSNTPFPPHKKPSAPRKSPLLDRPVYYNIVYVFLYNLNASFPFKYLLPTEYFFHWIM